MVISIDHLGEKLQSFGNPIRMSETPISEYQSAPRLGADNRDLLEGLLGFGPEDVERLKKKKII